MSDYGKTVPFQITSVYDFLAIWDAMEEDGSGFVHNRASLIDGFRINLTGRLN